MRDPAADMVDPATVLDRLRSEPAHGERLASLLVQALMDTPTEALIDPPELVDTLHWGLSCLAKDPSLVRKAIEALDERIQGLSPQMLQQASGELVPMTLVLPLQTLLGAPITPNRAILAACLDHPGMRQLIEELLQHELSAFAQKVRRLVPDAPSSVPVPGKRLASRIAGVAKGVAAAVGSEIERQMEDRTRDFVDDALARSVGRMIDRMANEEFAPQLATWRVNVLHALLLLPLEDFATEWNKLDQDTLATAMHDTLVELSQWEGLVPLLEQLCQEIWPQIRHQTLRDLAEPLQATRQLETRAKAPLTRLVGRVLAHEEFEPWLTELHR